MRNDEVKPLEFTPDTAIFTRFTAGAGAHPPAHPAGANSAARDRGEMSNESRSPGEITPAEKAEILRVMRLLGALGLTVVATIVGCFLAGLWVSRRYGLGLAPVAIGVVAGVVLSFCWVYRTLMQQCVAAPAGTPPQTATEKDPG